VTLGYGRKNIRFCEGKQLKSCERVVLLWAYLARGRFGQSTTSTWESLAPGNAIYVRGERATGMPTMRARRRPAARAGASRGLDFSGDWFWRTETLSLKRHANHVVPK
jgi:hypothetical protein